MEYLSITKYAELKGCHRNAIYLAGHRNDIDIDKAGGVAIIFLNKKNRKWQPSVTYQNNGLRKKTIAKVK